MNIFESLKDGLYTTFIVDDRYKLFLEGFVNTIIIAIFATILGSIIGIIVAIAKVYCSSNKKLKIFDILLSIYLTVIRGTPIVIQLLIVYFIVLANVENALIVAIFAFGLNSGAYVAEIVRAGIQSVDKGQMEAGRSLGFTRYHSMVYIIMPQAIKNILPALCNEFITLLKETSVAGYIAIMDLTKVGDIVRAQTFDAYFPLLSVAAIYLVLVLLLTSLVRVFERRLSKNDKS